MKDKEINDIAREISDRKNAFLTMNQREMERMDPYADPKRSMERLIDIAASSVSESLLIEFDGISQAMCKSINDVNEAQDLNQIVITKAAKNVIEGLKERVIDYEKFYGTDFDIDVEE